MSQDIKRIKRKKGREDDHSQDLTTEYRNQNINNVDLNISNLVTGITDMVGQTNEVNTDKTSN